MTAAGLTSLGCVIADVGAGWVGIVASEDGLLLSTFPQPSRDKAASLIAGYRAVDAPGRFAGVVQRLRGYFAGQCVDFSSVEVDLSSGSEFQRRVWEKTRSIPHGETRSYRWLAAEVATPRAARAVGQALGRNPLPVIIPCHRVVTSEGKLGGFGGGLALKEALLRLENTRGAISRRP